MKFSQAMIGCPADAVVEVAAFAESVGFASVALSDHLVYPKTLRTRYPYSADGVPQFEPQWDFPDPWVTIAAIASRTTRLSFLTNVFVLPARHPIGVAKTVGTAAALSGGRVSLGIGAGWMREEFDIVGVPFERRGARMDEMIEVMQALWSGGFVEHHGEFYDFEPVEMKPTPSEHIPILVGGDSEVALRRAARLDGWIGVNYSMDVLQQKCEQVLALRAELGRGEEPFEIVASPLAAPSPANVEVLERMGVTTVLTSAWIANRVRSPEGAEHAKDLIGSYAANVFPSLGLG